jgi:hypothetical protein
VNSFGNFFSIVFHPLFITTYIAAFLIFIHPSVFAGADPLTKKLKLILVALFTVVFPAFTVFLCWRLKLVRSLHLATSRERIVPYILAMFFYFMTWFVFKNNMSDNPPVILHLLLGSFLAICGGWMCNIFFKVSMHAMAMGGLITFAILFSFTDNYSSGLYLSIAILIGGIVCTSRLIVSDHSPFEIYIGLIVGALGQFIGWLF